MATGRQPSFFKVLKGDDFCEKLPFFYSGNSEFYVHIYGIDACKREFAEVAREVSDSAKWNYVSRIEEADSDDASVQAGDDDDDKEEDDDEDDDFENEADSEDKDEYVEEEVESDRDEGKSDDSIDILDEFPQCSKVETKRTSSGLHKRKINCSQAKAQSIKRRASGWSSNQRIKALKQNGTGELIARHRAADFMSKSVDPSCLIVMSPSYVKGSCVHFPREFSYRHLKMKCSHINLRVNKKSWSLNIYQGIRNKSFKLQAGWPEFVRENNLKEGDVCVFVLNETIRYVFDVTIFRTTEAADCTLPGARQKR
uniref:B3 domain-containing protein REM19-like n=1 Tax=Fragaria vesca subsp. vesca TaxID=101020 RepID=UPI0005CA32FE|nr:PREDICTED: B3 domain-containing protein REM19-like [Fragaria vesca subsp. vesca]